jgi:hypothetical protein
LSCETTPEHREASFFAKKRIDIWECMPYDQDNVWRKYTKYWIEYFRIICANCKKQDASDEYFPTKQPNVCPAFVKRFPKLCPALVKRLSNACQSGFHRRKGLQ